MPGVLNLAETGNEYTNATTLLWPGAISVVLDISNAAVLYQLREPVDGLNEAAWPWAPPAGIIAVPTFQTLARRTAGIRFKSAKAGVPAVVSAQLLGSNDLAGS